MEQITNQSLTKKEKYLLKREQKEKERFSLMRKKKIKKTIFISLPVLLIVGGIIFGAVNYFSGRNQSISEVPKEMPKIEINPLEYDIGTVSMKAGLVKKTFEIRNIGKGDLKITSSWTSCHCTTAVLRVRDKKSPEVGMEPRFFSQKITPEETGYLEVTFDPAFHGPSGIGPAVRAVYLSTNDPQNKEVEVRLVANVVK